MFELYLGLLFLGVILQFSALLRNLILQYVSLGSGVCKSRSWDLAFASGVVMVIAYSLHKVDVVLLTAEVVLLLIYFKYSSQIQK